MNFMEQCETVIDFGLSEILKKLFLKNILHDSYFA